MPFGVGVFLLYYCDLSSKRGVRLVCGVTQIINNITSISRSKTRENSFEPASGWCRGIRLQKRAKTWGCDQLKRTSTMKTATTYKSFSALGNAAHSAATQSFAKPGQVVRCVNCIVTWEGDKFITVLKTGMCASLIFKSASGREITKRL